VYQGVLSGKPLLAVLHEKSSAAQVVGDSGAGLVLSFSENSVDTIEGCFTRIFQQYLLMMKDYNADKINMEVFNNYSAKNATGKLAGLLNKAISQQP
jgi:hypothetical protein